MMRLKQDGNRQKNIAVTTTATKAENVLRESNNLPTVQEKQRNP